ncbi:hypothetical protein ScPMuIL_010862 [Solemya velum]
MVLGTIVLVAAVKITLVLSACPHDDASLLSWFDPDAWPNAQVPGEGDSVVIKSKIVLSESPAELTSITIEPSGQLVIAPGTINITTGNIHIKGRLDIGSDVCRYKGKLNIKLKGKRSAVESNTEFGQKYIGVDEGGTLEMHGEDKLSWTKLSKSVEKTTPLFQFKYGVEPFNIPTGTPGIVICVWNPDSRGMKSCRFYRLTGRQTKTSLQAVKDLFASLAEGDMMMFAVQQYIFPRNAMVPLYDEIEKLGWGSSGGQSQIRNIQKRDPYVFFAQKGNTLLTQEKLVSADKKMEATIVVTSTGSTFTVTSSVDPKIIRNSFVNFRVAPTADLSRIIDVIDPVSSWTEGDEILLLSTDYDWKQTEVAEIAACPECTPFQVKINADLKYTHFGEMIESVDMRGEVALVTRSIRIAGIMEDGCPQENGNCDVYDRDTHGGHLKVVEHFTNLHIQGVLFENMGQQTDLGRYPIHFHMCYDVDGDEYPDKPWIRNNTIYKSNARCLTIHGTNGLEVTDNVCWDALGHGFFLEDGGEQRNKLTRNLAGGQRSVKNRRLIPSDSEPASYWITNPMNYLDGNVAAGSSAMGFWILYPEQPTGESGNPKDNYVFMEPKRAFRTPFYQFTNNVAHSNQKSGLFLDKTIKPDLTLSRLSSHEPKEDPTFKKSKDSFTTIFKFTSYKNSEFGIWTNGGPFHVERSSFEVGKTISECVILGETVNFGEPTDLEKDGAIKNSYRSQPPNWEHPRQGVAMYQGPVLIQDSYFNYFAHSEDLGYHSGAISFKQSNRYPLSPMNTVNRVVFGFVDGPSTGNRVYDGTVAEHFNRNGNKVAMFHDLDGSVTTVRDSYVMRNGAYFMTEGCSGRDNWNAIVCPTKHGKVQVNLKKGKRVDFFLVRDDESGVIADVSELEMGPIPKSFIARLEGDYSYTLHWEGEVPSEFLINIKGADRGDSVRIGACIGKNADFELVMTGSVDAKWSEKGTDESWIEASDLGDLDNDTVGNKYYYDASTGVVYVKFIEFFERQEGDMRSCAGECPRLRVLVKGKRADNGDCRAYQTINGANTQAMPSFSSDLLKTSSSLPEGWGAGATRIYGQNANAAVAGGLSEWSGYSKCHEVPHNDNVGYKTRQRGCTKPSPENGGAFCTGYMTEVVSCTLG